MSASRSVGRGSGDTLSRRLSSLRAVILARGRPSFVLSANGCPSVTVRCSASIPRAFDYFRRRGASVVNVLERRTLGGLSCYVDSRGVDWLLLSKPVLISHERQSASQKS